MKESLQSRMGKAQIKIIKHQSYLAGYMSGSKERAPTRFVTPQTLIIACIAGFLSERYLVSAGRRQPIKNPARQQNRATFISGFSGVLREIIDTGFYIYTLSRKLVNGRQVVQGRNNPSI